MMNKGIFILVRTAKGKGVSGFDACGEIKNTVFHVIFRPDKKVCLTRRHTEKANPLIVATQSIPFVGKRKERKHFLPKYFPTNRISIRLCSNISIPQPDEKINAFSRDEDISLSKEPEREARLRDMKNAFLTKRQEKRFFIRDS